MTSRKNTCEFRQKCHFYAIKDKSPQSQRLQEHYCDDWPEKCDIFRRRANGLPVSITLWPNGQEVQFRKR